MDNEGADKNGKANTMKDVEIKKSITRLKTWKRSTVSVLCIFALAIGILAGTPLSEAKMRLNKTEVTLTVGQSVQLELKGAKKKVTWKTSDPSVATVSKKGFVSAKAAGEATITAKSGKKSYSCAVTVNPIPTDYTIVRTEGAPDWGSVPVFPIDQVLWMPDVGIRAQGQLCHDDDYIYVHLQATEANIRAENTQPLSPVYEDSCLEFFFMRDGADGYFNFESNPNGVLDIQYGPDKLDRTFLLREDATEYFDIHADRTSDGWEISYRIPLVFIRMIYPDFSFSDILRANAYKCGNKTVQRHYLAWKPVHTDAPNFHVPEDFGTMSFE
ncbi:MAG: Ig-like domain-containing protein [Eubacterium sp.]|nr:Ig-like domain-containing protein [Eubacterium sp.]